MKKPLIMLDLNESSRYGGPYIVANRIANSGLKKDFDFTFLRFGNDGQGSLSLSRLRCLVGQIKAKNPDLVHFSGLQLSGFMVAAACLLAGNYKSLMTIRGTSADALDIGRFKKFLVAYIFEPVTCLLTKRFYCNSSYTESRAISRFFSYKRLPYIYNFWGDTSSASREKKLSRKSINLDNSDVVVVSTGRITYDKGFGLYCEIVELVSQHESSVKFLLVGDGAYLETLKFRLSKFLENGSVICLGFRDDVSSINALADVYLNPSLHETLSISTMEAMSAGLPAVVSNEGGLRELVVESESGYKCAISSPECFAEKIISLTNDVATRRYMGQAASTRVASSMSENIITRDLKSVYMQVLYD